MSTWPSKTDEPCWSSWVILELALGLIAMSESACTGPTTLALAGSEYRTSWLP